MRPESGPAPLTGVLTAEDGQKIFFTHFSSNRDRCVVISHGFYNSQDAVLLQDLARTLFADVYDVLLFDYRGHGKSSGLFTWTARETMDLKVVLESIRPHYRKVGLIGFSLGGSIAINTLANCPQLADALIAVAAPSSLWRVDYRFWEKGMWKDFLYTLLSSEGRKGKGVWPGPFWLKKESPLKNIARLALPVLFLHGTSDWVVKPWHSRCLYEAAISSRKLVLIDEGPHAEYLMRDNRVQFLAEVRAWFKETL